MFRPVIFCIIFCLGVLVGISASANQPGQLRSSGSGHTWPSEMGRYHYTVSSSYREEAALSLEMQTIIRDLYLQIRQSPRQFNRMYRYDYVIENPNPGRLQVNFSNWEFSHSPFVRATQSFQIEIPAEHRYEVSYDSVWGPTRILSPINIGFRHRDSNHFSYAGGGQVSLYLGKAEPKELAVLRPVQIRRMSPEEIKKALEE